MDKNNLDSIIDTMTDNHTVILRLRDGSRVDIRSAQFDRIGGDLFSLTYKNEVIFFEIKEVVVAELVKFK